MGFQKSLSSCPIPAAIFLKPVLRNNLVAEVYILNGYCLLLPFLNVPKAVILLTSSRWLISGTFPSRILPKHNHKKSFHNFVEEGCSE